MSGAWLLCPHCYFPMFYQGGEHWKCFVCIYTKADPKPVPSIKWDRPDQEKIDAPNLGAEPARDEDDEDDQLPWD